MSRRLAVFTAIVFTGCLRGTVAPAKRPPLKMGLMMTRIIRAPARIRQVFVSDPKVVVVKLADGDRAYVLGFTPGQADVTLALVDGRRLTYRFDVHDLEREARNSPMGQLAMEVKAGISEMPGIILHVYPDRIEVTGMPQTPADAALLRNVIALSPSVRDCTVVKTGCRCCSSAEAASQDHTTSSKGAPASPDALRSFSVPSVRTGP